MPELSHARHDRIHVLAPRLFLSLPRGKVGRPEPIIYEYTKGKTVEFRCYQQLGVNEMRVLQALVAMAGQKGAEFTNRKSSEQAHQLVASMFDGARNMPKRADEELPVLVVKDSYSTLLEEMGLSRSGANMKKIQASIEALFGVMIFVQHGSKRVGMHLLSSYASDEGKGDLYVALNPILAKAILGGGNQYCHIDMNEARQIKSDPARLLHQRLSGWIDPPTDKRPKPKQGVVSIDTLCEYVWPKATKPERLRWQRMKIRDALNELQALGWTVDISEDDLCSISRPKISFCGVS